MTQSTANIEVMEGCQIKITGISAERAGEIVKSWDFDPKCRLEVKTKLDDGT